MKKIRIYSFRLFFGLLILASYPVKAKPPEEVLIRDFLSYISRPGWHIDTVTKKFVLFYAEESKVASRMKRKFYLSMAINELANELKKTQKNSLTVLPYDSAESKLQIMELDSEFRKRSFIVTNPDRSFIRYFLIKDDLIEAFVLYRKKAYLLLN